MRGHLRGWLKLRGNSEQFVRDTTEALRDIPDSSGHEVRGQTRCQLGGDVRSPGQHAGIGTDAAYNHNVPAVSLRLSYECDEPGY